MKIHPVPLLQAAWQRLVAAVVASVLGTAMLHKVEDLRRYVAASPSFVRDQDRAEVRVQAIFIVGVFLLLLVEPLYYLYIVPDAPITWVVATLPSRWCVVGAFGLCILGAIPHLWTLLFRPDLLGHQCFRVWATLAALGAAVVWIVLATLAEPLHAAGGLEGAYVIRALAMLCISGIYAFSVNAQHLREVADAPHD